MRKDPTRTRLSSPEKEGSTVRQRTLSHLENLMRKATTVGAGIILACGAKAQTAGPPQVVDPLPPPVGCCENPDELVVRGCLGMHAQWVKSGMRWTILLSLSANSGPNRVSFEGLKREAIRLGGVSIANMKVEAQKLGFALTAGASNRKATMQFPVLCNGKKITIKLALDLSKLPAQGASVPVKLVK